MTGQSIWRNLFHFSGIVIPISYLLVGKSVALGVTTSLFCLLLVTEFLRMTGRLQLEAVGNFLKEKERNRPTGSVFYMFAALLTILLFSEEVATCSLFILCVSDPLSSLAGRRLGKHPLLGKSVEGVLTFFFSSLIILTLFSIGLLFAVFAASIATLTELFTPEFLDDNLTIPIITGTALTLLGV